MEIVKKIANFTLEETARNNTLSARNNNMKPSETVKKAGLKSLTELSTLSGVERNTLANWHRDKPLVFKTLLAGAIALKSDIVCMNEADLPNNLKKQAE